MEEYIIKLENVDTHEIVNLLLVEETFAAYYGFKAVDNEISERQLRLSKFYWKLIDPESVV